VIEFTKQYEQLSNTAWSVFRILVMTCTFCKIVSRELGSQVVFEDAVSLAFLDRRPLFAGHCLLIPKIHYETLAELPVKQIEPIFRNTQILARAVEQAMGAEGSFVAINNRISQSVPHLHIHIVPRRKKDGLKGFFWPRNPYVDDSIAQKTAEAVRETLACLLASQRFEANYRTKA
jgi:histidine triad (HIT) family protein